MGALGGDGMLALVDGGKLALGDSGTSAAGLQRVLGNYLLEEAVDYNLLMKMSDNCCEAVAVSFLSLKRGGAEECCKTSIFFQLS